MFADDTMFPLPGCVCVINTYADLVYDCARLREVTVMYWAPWKKGTKPRTALLTMVGGVGDVVNALLVVLSAVGNVGEP